MSVELYFANLKIENIKSNEFEIMKDMFGEKEVNNYFEKVLDSDNHYDIDKVNKIMDNYVSSFENNLDSILFDSGTKYLDDAFIGYLLAIKNIGILTMEDNNKYGKLLLDNRDVFDVSFDDINNIFKDKVVTKIGKRMLDMEKIFVSIRNENDKKEIIELLSNYYYGSEIWNENNIDRTIKCYIKDYKLLCNMVDGIPDYEQLNDFFKNKSYNVFPNFDINNKTNDIYGLKKNLKKYLTYMYARNYMVIHNLKLVCSMSYKYKGPNNSIMDVINDGNLGLLYAVDRYDYTKGRKFSSFSYLSIKRSILRERDNTDRLVRVPVYFNDICRKINQYREMYVLKNGIEPSSELISNQFDVSLNIVNEIFDYEDNFFVLASLNNLSGEEENMELVDCIRSRGLSVDEQAMRNVVNSILLEVINELDEKEKDIVMKRFGFDDNFCMTLEEIGNDYNVSRQRINEILTKVLKKMSRKKKIRDLKGFYKY